MLPTLYDRIDDVLDKLTDTAHFEQNGHLLAILDELRKIRDEIPHDDLSDAYNTVMNSIETTEFKKWLKAIKDKLEFDYDQYRINCADSDTEELGFEIWALGRYLEGELKEMMVK
jgi:hypothetical protein